MTELWTKIKPLNNTNDPRDVVKVIEKTATELERAIQDNTWHDLYDLEKEKVYIVRITVEEVQ